MYLRTYELHSLINTANLMEGGRMVNSIQYGLVRIQCHAETIF